MNILYRGSLIFAAFMIAAAPTRAVAPVRVAYAGRVVTTPAPVVPLPGGTLVPLRAVAQALGGRMTWDEASRTAVASRGARRLEVDQSTHTLRLNGQPLTGLPAPRAAQGQILVPLAAVERLFGVRGRWLPEQRLLSFAASRRQPPEKPMPTTQRTESSGGVQLSLTSDRHSYAAGAPVALTLTVTNPARSPVTLQFASGQKYDFEVRRAGQVVWRWSADRMFTQALTSLTLGPGERRDFTETWKQQDNHGQPVPPGTYEVVATLTTMARPQPQSAPLTIRIGG